MMFDERKTFDSYMYHKMSTVMELGRCKVSAEALNGGRGHAILLTIASWAVGETVTGFPRPPSSDPLANQNALTLHARHNKFAV